MTRFRLSWEGGLEAPRGRLHRVGQHDQGRLLALGRRSRVAVVLLLDLLHLRVVDLLGLVEEIPDERAAVVLLDDLLDLLGELQLPGDLRAFLDVVDDDQRAQARRHVPVQVGVPARCSR